MKEKEKKKERKEKNTNRQRRISACMHAHTDIPYLICEPFGESSKRGMS